MYNTYCNNNPKGYHSGITRGGCYMFNLISKGETQKIVVKLINELTKKYTYFEMAILLGVNEKTIYKWRSGYIPKADNYINLQILHDSTAN